MKLAAFLLCPLTLFASWNGCIGGVSQNSFGPDWGQMEFGVEALYWKPDNGGFDYLLTPADEGRLLNASVHTLRPDYDWGVRGTGRYFSPSGCTALEFSGLWIRSTDSVNKPRTNGFIAFSRDESDSGAAARLRIEYWNLDLRLTQFLVRDPRYNIYALGGARFASHSFKEASAGLFDPQTNGLVPVGGAIESRFDGAGPEVGIGGDVCIWQGFSLISHSSIYAIVGERRTRGATIRPEQALKFDRATVISPCLNIRVAIRYCLSWSCFQLSGEMGYELDHYWNALNVVPSLNGANNQQRLERDIGWAGPYAGLMVGF
jgi:Legionella pneumophila major outer membrane protein precursor